MSSKPSDQSKSEQNEVTEDVKQEDSKQEGVKVETEPEKEQKEKTNDDEESEEASSPQNDEELKKHHDPSGESTSHPEAAINLSPSKIECNDPSARPEVSSCSSSRCTTSETIGEDVSVDHRPNSRATTGPRSDSVTSDITVRDSALESEAQVEDEEGDVVADGEDENAVQALDQFDATAVDAPVQPIHVPIQPIYPSKNRKLLMMKRMIEIQKSCISKAAFARLVREVGHSIKPRIRFREAALKGLQQSSEEYLIGRFMRAGNEAQKDGRELIKLEDFS